MSTPPLARRERHELCDLALVLGSDAPTLCGDWTALDLVTHLLVRENRPLGALGIAVAPLSGLTEHAMARLARRDFAVLVEKLRDPGVTPYRLPPVEVLANTLEYAVHHEDLRRAQPGWSPRSLAAADDDLLWRLIRVSGRMLVRPSGVPVRIRRSGRDGAVATLRRGSDPVTITGQPLELVLFLFGRQGVADVELDGPPAAADRLRGATLGF